MAKLQSDRDSEVKCDATVLHYETLTLHSWRNAVEAAEREERNHRCHGANEQQAKSREKEQRLAEAEVPRRREKYNSHWLGFQVGLYVIGNGYMGHV